jgi:hypothetical protein
LKTSKEIEKRILAKKTINEMNRFITNLQEQKSKYLNSAKIAKEKGLTAQLNLALSALKSVMLQEQRAQEMLLNFEITNGMKDMAGMTSGFLKGMGQLSKDMIKLTNNKEFMNVQKDFEKAIIGLEIRTEEIDAFLDMNQSTFENLSSASKIKDEDILALIEDEKVEESGDHDIDSEILKIQKLLKENNQ